jgi:fructoselysine transporter
MAEIPVAPRRELTFLQSTALIIGTVIGSGVFISLPIVARIAGSPLMSVLIWFAGGVLWIPQILVLAEMGTAYPTQGGPYVYLQKAGFPFFAFLYTWTAFLTSDTPTLTIVALSAMSALEFFSPIFGDPAWSRVLGGLLIAVLTYIQVRSVRIGGNLQILFTFAKLTPLLSIVIIGLFWLGSGKLASPAFLGGVQRSLLAVLTAGISSTLWSYAGFTNILYVAGEVKNPQRVLPVSLIGSLLFVMIAYTLISTCTSAIVPFHDLLSAEGDFVNPFAYVPYLTGVAGTVFALAAFISMIGVLNATILMQPRLEYAMARDGLFFSIFGRLHPRYLTPYTSIIIQSALAIVLFLLGDIGNLLGYFTLSYALQNLLLYGAIFFLRRRPDYQPTYRAPAWAFMGVMAILTQVYLAVGTVLAYPAGGVLACAGLILTGFPIYRYYARQRTKEATA